MWFGKYNITSVTPFSVFITVFFSSNFWVRHFSRAWSFYSEREQNELATRHLAKRFSLDSLSTSNSWISCVEDKMRHFTLSSFKLNTNVIKIPPSFPNENNFEQCLPRIQNWSWDRPYANTIAEITFSMNYWVIKLIMFMK